MNGLKDKLLSSPKTLLTALVAAGWGLSWVVRIYKPEFTLGASFDAVTSTVMGYYFTQQQPKVEEL
jgi:hypothetical protein